MAAMKRKNNVADAAKLSAVTTPLRNNEQVLSFIQTLIAEVRGGIILPKAANALGYLLNVRLYCLPVESTRPARSNGPNEPVLQHVWQLSSCRRPTSVNAENSVHRLEKF